MPDTFISYSRKDEAFGLRLHGALKTEKGLSVWMDWQDIPRTASWWEEICRGIEGSDNIIFIMSPESLSSPVCNLEIEHARAYNKRIIAVLYKTFDDRAVQDALVASPINDYVRTLVGKRDLRSVAKENLLKLYENNWTVFDHEATFEDFVVVLIEALKVDIAHVHEHTRVLVRTLEWIRIGRKSDYVLHGQDLVTVEAWRNLSLGKKPELTKEQIEYIDVSRKAQDSRQRLRLASLTGALVVVLLFAIIALIQSEVASNESNTRATQQQIAENNAVKATLAQGLAIFNAATAVSNASTATVAQGQALSNAATAEYRSTLVAEQAATSESNLMEAWRSQSRFLANQSIEQAHAGNSQTALLLALESVAHYPQIYSIDNQVALLDSLSAPVQEFAYFKHDSRVLGAVWSQDESRVLSWSTDGTARIWNAITGKQLAVMQHDGIVWGAAWNPLETQVLTWSNKCENFDASVPGECSTHEATIWDTGTFAPIRLIHDDFVAGASWSHDGKYVLTWSFDRTARLWDGHTGKPLRTMRHEGAVNGAQWSPDGSRILTWSELENTTRVWSVENNNESLILPHKNENSPITYLEGAVWSPNGDYVLTWGTDGSIQIWPMNNPSSRVMGQHSYPVTGAVWSPNEDRILSWNISDTWKYPPVCSNEKCAAFIWWLDGVTSTLTLPHNSPVYGAAWSPDETMVLTWTTGGQLQVWNSNHTLSIDENAVITRHHSDLIYGATWSNDERKILSWSEDGTAVVWSLDGSFTSQVMHHNSAVYGALWNKDESKVLTWTQDGSVRIWILNQTGALQSIFYSDTVQGATWDNANEQVLSWSNDGTAKILSLDGTLKQAELDNAAGGKWSPDQSYVALWSYTELAIWDTRRGITVRMPDAEDIGDLQWSYNGKQILTWSGINNPGAIQLWDVKTGSNIRSFRHPGADFVRGEWSNDEQSILSAGGNSILVWDSKTADIRLNLPNPGVLGASWDRKNTRIVSWSFLDEVGTVRMWNSLKGDLIWESPITAYDVVWNSDQTRLLVRTPDTIVILDAETGTKLYTYLNGDGLIGARWNSDGTRILTWDGNGGVKIWEVDGGNNPVRQWYITDYVLNLDWGSVDRSISGAIWSPDETKILFWALDHVYVWNWEQDTLYSRGLGSTVNGAAWSSDGTRIVSWSNGGIVEVLVDDPDKLIALAHSHAIRQLSNNERIQFALPTIAPTGTTDH